MQYTGYRKRGTVMPDHGDTYRRWQLIWSRRAQVTLTSEGHVEAERHDYNANDDESAWQQHSSQTATYNIGRLVFIYLFLLLPLYTKYIQLISESKMKKRTKIRW